MTAVELIASLKARGVELVPMGDRLRFRPARVVTAADLAAMRRLKPALIALLEAEFEVKVPDDPCGLRGSPLAWVTDWPAPSNACWLCPTCAAWPVPALVEVFASLTSNERRRLDTEAALGDKLALAVLRDLRGVRRAAV